MVANTPSSELGARRDAAHKTSRACGALFARCGRAVFALLCAVQPSALYVCVCVCVCVSVCGWLSNVTVVICGVSSHEPSGTRAEVPLQVPTLGTRISVALPCLGYLESSSVRSRSMLIYKVYASASSCHAASYRPVIIISTSWHANSMA